MTEPDTIQALRHALRDAEARLQALAAGSFEGIIFSERGRIVEANGRYAEMVGARPQDLIGAAIAEFVVPEDRERVVANIHAARESFVEHRIRTLDGRVLVVEAHGRPIEYHGRVVRVTAVRDVTQQRREQEQLRRLNRSLHALGRSAQTVLRATDEAAFYRDVCRIIVEDCGHRMVWVGLAVHDDECSVRPVAFSGFEEGYLETLRVTWADTDRGRGPTGTAIRTGEVCTCRNMLTDLSFLPWRAQATQRGYASSIALPLVADGTVFGALTIYCAEPDPFSDEEIALLTDLANDFGYGVQVLRLRAAHAAAEQALRDADRRKDEFLAMLSHELRTPLNAVVGWSHMLLSGALDEASRRRAVEVIARNAQTQAQIVNDVLDVSRIITGKIVLSVREVDLADVVRQAIESVTHAADAKGVTLHLTVEPGLVLAGDPDRLQQVLWNILSNAVKFTPARGSVTIVADRDGPDLRVRVSDTGAGIPAAFLPHVFDRFSQADASVGRADRGLGLGLAIVRHFVELHGGTVQAESAGEGFGSAFTIRLPVRAGSPGRTAAAPSCPPSPPPEAPAGPCLLDADLRGARILVVDDELDAREVARTVLEACGARVVAAGSAAGALEALGGGVFDLLVADIGMPVEDGYGLIAKVRMRSAIPAIALTAYGREADRALALEAGYNHHVVKPVLPDALAAAAARAIGRAPSQAPPATHSASGPAGPGGAAAGGTPPCGT